MQNEDKRRPEPKASTMLSSLVRKVVEPRRPLPLDTMMGSSVTFTTSPPPPAAPSGSSTFCGVSLSAPSSDIFTELVVFSQHLRSLPANDQSATDGSSQLCFLFIVSFSLPGCGEIIDKNILVDCRHHRGRKGQSHPCGDETRVAREG